MGQFPGFNLRALDRARISRDPRFDGKFFIAVTSTRVYCRPVCPVRSPKRSNIRYFLSAAAAADAGFRPCLRCRPEAAPGTPAWHGTSAVVSRALRLIDAGFLDRGSVEGLADQLGIGSRHLHRLFVHHVGAPPIAMAQTRRLHFAKKLLDETRLPVTDIALAAGYGSLRRFNSAFQQTYKRSPRELRKSRTANATASSSDDLVLRLAYRPPYDWQQVRDFLARRAIPGMEIVDDQGYQRSIRLETGHGIVRVRPVDDQNTLELRVCGAAPAALFQISATARRVFDLSADLSAIAQSFRSDPLLGLLVKARPGLRIPGVWDPLECLVRAIIGQQVSVAAGRTLLARVVARAGKKIGGAGDVVAQGFTRRHFRSADGSDACLTHLFPTAQELLSASLEGLGLTNARIAALKSLALGIVEGRIALNSTAEEVVSALVELPGVGDWTAQYFALRALGEPDAFPASDLILRRMAGSPGNPLTTRALALRSEAWRPWRGYAVMHLWQAATDAAAGKVA